MTTDTILRAVADLVLSIHPGGVAGRKGDALCAALGLSPDASWDEAAAALCAHADSLAPGLPEGWEVLNGVITYPDARRITAHGPIGDCVTLAIRPDGIRWHGHTYAPPAVYAYLLARAQGVGS